MAGLKTSEIHWIVNSYIGVSGGYLGDFTYRSHREFYPAFCDLDLNPEAYSGTTRERFVALLNEAEPRHQAAILRGVAARFPMGSEVQRTAASHLKLLDLASRCDDSEAVAGINPKVSSDVLQRALSDAATLVGSDGGPISAVDRIHTALHAYLKAVCRSENLEYPEGATITQLFKVVRQGHPRLRDLGNHSDTVTRILQSLANVVDSLNPVRNKGSLAHANEHLLDKEDALLAINAARTVFQYIDARIG